MLCMYGCTPDSEVQAVRYPKPEIERWLAPDEVTSINKTRQKDEPFYTKIYLDTDGGYHYFYEDEDGEEHERF